MTRLKSLHCLKDRLESPYVVSYFFNVLPASHCLGTPPVMRSLRFQEREASGGILPPSSVLAVTFILLAPSPRFVSRFGSVPVVARQTLAHE